MRQRSPDPVEVFNAKRNKELLRSVETSRECKLNFDGLRMTILRQMAITSTNSCE